MVNAAQVLFIDCFLQKYTALIQATVAALGAGTTNFSGNAGLSSRDILKVVMHRPFAQCLDVNQHLFESARVEFRRERMAFGG